MSEASSNVLEYCSYMGKLKVIISSFYDNINLPM